MKSRFISPRPARLGLLYLFIVGGQCHTHPLMHVAGVLGCCTPVVVTIGVWENYSQSERVRIASMDMEVPKYLSPETAKGDVLLVFILHKMYRVCSKTHLAMTSGSLLHFVLLDCLLRMIKTARRTTVTTDTEMNICRRY